MLLVLILLLALVIVGNCKAMRKRPKVKLRYVGETLRGKRIDGIYYRTLEQAEMCLPEKPLVIWKVWITEQ